MESISLVNKGMLYMCGAGGVDPRDNGGRLIEVTNFQSCSKGQEVLTRVVDLG